MTYRTSIATLTIGLLMAGQVTAQAESQQPLVPLPSVFDYTGGGGWGVALGAAVEYGEAYDGSDEYGVELEPAGAIQWRRDNHLFYWEGIELGWRSRVADRWLIQAGTRYESGLEPDDSEEGALDGIEERDAHIAGFVEARYSLGADWKNWIATRIMGGESGFGWLGIIAAGHRFDAHTDGSGTEMFVYSTFASDDFINKDFGVTPTDAAASGLPATVLDGGYRASGINLVHRRHITPTLEFIAAAEAELYSSEIADSPLSRNDHEAEVELALVKVF
jgi:outer membrane protein